MLLCRLACVRMRCAHFALRFGACVSVLPRDLRVLLDVLCCPINHSFVSIMINVVCFIIQQQNETMSASESVTSSVVDTSIERKLNDLCVRYTESDIGSQISYLALTASNSVLAVLDGDEAGEFPLELSAEDIADMLPTTPSAIAGSFPIDFTSSASFKSRVVSSEISVGKHHENFDNSSICDRQRSTDTNELEQQPNRGDSKCEPIEHVCTVNDERINEQYFHAGVAVKLTSVATVESANKLTSKVSQTSSKSSDVWPLPPSDNESNSCLKGWDIHSGAIEYQKFKLEKEPTAEENETTFGVKRKTATMKIGVSEKVFQHSSLYDDVDSMQRFK